MKSGQQFIVAQTFVEAEFVALLCAVMEAFRTQKIRVLLSKLRKLLHITVAEDKMCGIALSGNEIL